MQYVLQSIADLIIENVSVNYNNVTTQEDFERATERFCEVAAKLGVSNIEIGKRIPQIEETY